jgi:hypothetical protein
LVITLASLDVPYNVLNIAESVCCCKLKDNLAIDLELAFFQIFVLSLDVVEWLQWVNDNIEDFLSYSPKDIFKVSIRGCIKD